MDKAVLKQEIVDVIKSDPLLYGEVANALGVAPMSLTRILKANDKRLTQFSVLQIIRKHTGERQDKNLLQQMQQIN
jgi:hypothetical protein